MENQFPSKTHQVAKLPSELVVGVLRTPDKNPFHFSHKDKIDELEVLAFDQKIKKIHKKKFKENYKNIELIQSVYDAPTNNNSIYINNSGQGAYVPNSLQLLTQKGALHPDEFGEMKDTTVAEAGAYNYQDIIKNNESNIIKQLYEQFCEEV